MAKRDLSWTTKRVVFSGGVCTNTVADWIEVNPSAATGDQSVEITTKNAESKSDPLSGCVIFTATLSDGTEISSSVTVVRCAYTCDCSKISGVTTHSETIPVSGKSDVELISFKIGGGCTDEVSFEYPTDGTWYQLSKEIDNDTVKLIGNFSENTTGSRNLTVKVKVNGTICTNIGEGGEFNFTQEGVSCGCANLVINTGVVNIGCEATSYTISNAFSFNCQGDNPPIITAKTSSNWVTGIVVNQSGSSIIYSVSNNAESSARTATLNFSAGTESCGNKTITINQSPCDCNCSTVDVTTTSQTWDYDATGSTNNKAIVNVGDSCNVDVVTLSNVPSWIGTGATGNTIYAWPTSIYSELCSQRSETINVQVYINGTHCNGKDTSVTVTQNGNTNISISASTDTIDCEGGTATFTIN